MRRILAWRRRVRESDVEAVDDRQDAGVVETLEVRSA